MNAMTRKLRMLIVAGMATGLLATAPAAGAATITVNSTGDAAADDGVCTLREAITSANTDSASSDTTGVGCSAGNDMNDTIAFDGTVFAGFNDEILIASNLPVITETLIINGCSADPNAVRPCVGLRRGGDATDKTAFDVQTTDVTIRGIAFAVVTPVITQDNTSLLVFRNNWIGPDVSGAVVLGSQPMVLNGDNALIGGDNGAPGTAPADRNVFRSTQQVTLPSLLIRGNNNQVRGNFFGTAADGITFGGTLSEDAIEVSGNGGTLNPVGNQIGAAVQNAEEATTTCDGACNVIVAATIHGIDLNGDGGGETSANGTSVAANFIGLSVNGTVDAGNGGDGVNVGASDQATIGGATTAHRNFIGGNQAQGVDTINGASSLSVRNNFIGLNSAGTVAIPNQAQAAVLNGGTFQQNRVGGSATEPTSGGLVIGPTAGATPTTALGNVFGVGTGGQDVGLPTSAIVVSSIAGANNAIIGGANLGDGNVIGNMRGAGIPPAISLAANGAQIKGNFIGVDADGTTARGNDGDGIHVSGGGQVDNTVIGGDTAAEENVISNNADDAIEIVNAGSDFNRVMRNRGSNNGADGADLFLDLTPIEGAGNTGPNEGILPPVVTAVNNQTISGTAAPNAVVRIYRTNTANGSAPTDILAFAGMATADGAGNWSHTFATALPVPGQVTANQTNATNSSSEFSNAMSYLAAPPPPVQPTPTPTPLTPIAAAPDNSAECAALRAKLKKAKSKRKKRKIRSQLKKLGC
jgi:CSLREA domain-containing protein